MPWDIDADPKISPEEFDAQMQSNLPHSRIDLSVLSDLRTDGMQNFPKIQEGLRNFEFRCPNLSHLVLHRCKHPDEFLKALLLPVSSETSPAFKSLQLTYCSCDWKNLTPIIKLP